MLNNETKEKVARSPLYDFMSQQHDTKLDIELSMEEIAPLHFFTLRGDLNNSTLQKALITCLQLELPKAPKKSSHTNQCSCYWLSPDEWLIVIRDECALANISQFDRQRPEHSALVDNSSGLTLLKLSGQKVYQLLMKSCCYDFSREAFQISQCVQTKFAKANAIIYKHDEQTFELIIRRSFADYLASWCVEASRDLTLTR